MSFKTVIGLYWGMFAKFIIIYFFFVEHKSLVSSLNTK